MRVLFFAYTPFQAISALAIKEIFYADDECDIILADSVQSRDAMKRNIESEGLFSQVYYGNLRKYFPHNENRIKHEINRIRSAFDETYIALDIGIENLKYDFFITTEINYYTESIYSLLRKHNGDIKVELMDEGYGSYTYYFREAYRPVRIRSKVRRLAFRIPGAIIGRKYIADDARILYLFSPELQCWDGNPYTVRHIEIKKYPEFPEKINLLFGYDSAQKKELEEEYREKFIFFEESLYWSHGNSNDEAIIKHIADLIGRKNLIIKLHPRNRINRFEKLGYKTNKSYGIPWELIAINLPDTEKIFITFSSSAASSYKFLCDKSFKTVMLYKCIGDQYYQVDPDVKKWLEKFSILHGDALYIPESIEEMDGLLQSFN